MIQLLADKVTDAMDDKVESAFAAYQTALKDINDEDSKKFSQLENSVLALTREVRALASEMRTTRVTVHTLSDHMSSGVILPARGSASGSLRRSYSGPLASLRASPASTTTTWDR